MVLIAPFTWREPAWGKALVDFFRSLLPLSVYPFRHLPIDHPGLVKQYQQYLPEIDLKNPDHQEELRHFQFPLVVLDQLRAVGREGYHAAQYVQTPTLLIHSLEDPVVQAKSIETLQARLTGRVIREKVYGPHSLTMPQNPAYKDVAAKTLAFAAQILQADSLENQ
jgi:alpha-beta hydrolase superfamily lysophospholipase